MVTMNGDVRVYTQTEISEAAGFTESSGRGWIKDLGGYISPIKGVYGRGKHYDEEAKQKLIEVKRMRDNGYNRKQIIDQLKNGIAPNNIEVYTPKLIKKTEVNVSDVLEVSNEQRLIDTIPLPKELTIDILEILADGNTRVMKKITEAIIQKHNLTEEQISVFYPNNRERVLGKRIRNVRYSLKSEGYIDEVSEGAYAITNKGLKLLSKDVTMIDKEVKKVEKVVDPHDLIKENINLSNKALQKELLAQIQKMDWLDFEKIVLKLLEAMGYGKGSLTPRSNDEGIDGVMQKDYFGRDKVYVQAKRYKNGNKVGREDAQKFIGALSGQNASFGLIITTSDFASTVPEFLAKAKNFDIYTINGKELVDYMIEFNIGVTVKETYVLKEVDFSIFNED